MFLSQFTTCSKAFIFVSYIYINKHDIYENKPMPRAHLCWLTEINLYLASVHYVFCWCDYWTFSDFKPLFTDFSRSEDLFCMWKNHQKAWFWLVYITSKKKKELCLEPTVLHTMGSLCHFILFFSFHSLFICFVVVVLIALCRLWSLFHFSHQKWHCDTET